MVSTDICRHYNHTLEKRLHELSSGHMFHPLLSLSATHMVSIGALTFAMLRGPSRASSVGALFSGLEKEQYSA